MSGVLFPDLLGTIGKASAIQQNEAQRAWLEEDRSAKKSASTYVPGALAGDKAALDKVASIHPETAMKIAPLLERLDAGQRAKAKETAEFITTNGMAILNAAPEAQPGLYARVRQEAQAAGRDVSTWPTQYDPGWVKFNVDKAMPVAEYYKRQGDGPQAMPAPGGFTGQVAKDESGGNYNIPNAKGSGAYGKYQFMPETWATVAQANPNLNLPLNMRQATPQQQEAAMEAFTRANGQVLQSAGIPATPDNLYLAHRFGADGARRFLSAPDNTPIAQVFPPKWIEQNPDLNTTVGQFKRGVQARYGGITAGREVDVAAGQAPATIGAEIDDIRRQVRSTGGDLFQRNGQIEIQNNHYVVRSIQNPRQIVGMIPIKPPKDPQDKGLFGDSLTGRALTALRTLTPDSQEYAAAYAILSKPQVAPDGMGGQTVIQPMNLSMFPKPTFAGGAFVEPAPAGGAAPGAPAPTQIPGGGTVTNIPGKGKALDNSARDDLMKKAAPALEMSELVKSFDPSFGGYVFDALGDSDNYRKRSFPDAFGGGDPKGQAQWWQRYQAMSNIERNALFGASLTAGETAAWKAATATPGMKPDQIKANLTRQNDIAQKALSRLANSLAASGFNKEAIEAAIGVKLGDLPGPQGGVPQPQDNAEKGRLLFEARKAIEQGAPRDKVIERLKENGVTEEP